MLRAPLARIQAAANRNIHFTMRPAMLRVSNSFSPCSPAKTATRHVRRYRIPELCGPQATASRPVCSDFVT